MQRLLFPFILVHLLSNVITQNPSLLIVSKSNPGLSLSDPKSANQSTEPVLFLPPFKIKILNTVLEQQSRRLVTDFRANPKHPIS